MQKYNELTRCSRYQLQDRNTLRQEAALAADTTKLSLCLYTDAETRQTQRV